MTDIINKWSVLRNLSKDFVSNIKSIYIYGTKGKQVIVITNDDNVYSFGDNDSNGCLGLGHTNPIQEPTIIEELCAKQVIHFEFGFQYNFVTALTQNGNVFSWGYNGNGELGIGNYASQSKPNIISALNDKNVIDIKSGYCHSSALTTCGDVYIWSGVICNTPIKMTFDVRNQKIIAISSGSHHTLALTNTGNVYYWGNNVYGQCGNANNDVSYDENWRESPKTIALHITKIACGQNHSMVLTKEGIVYCYGDNQYGQCGDGNSGKEYNPIKIKINAKFVDISATKHCNTSVGLTDTGSCYVWGEYGQNSIKNAIKIPCNDMNKVLEECSKNIVTLKPLRFTDDDYISSAIMDRISEKFNKREFSDIAFKVEDKCIYAQKTHLINVCKHFQSMFLDNNWIESNKSEIEIKDYSYSVYYAFIKYLYTDCVETSKDDDAMQLLDLANCYFEDTLKQRCVEIIKNSITNENVFAIYCSAIKYNLKLLKSYCIEYVKNNFANETNIEVIMDNAVKFTEK